MTSIELTPVEQAEKIISQWVLTDEDITELWKIKRSMSRMYHEFVSASWMKEEQYNLTRSKEYIKIKQKIKDDSGRKYTDRDADRIAKDRAEENFWSYRTDKAYAQGMKSQIDALWSVIMDYRARQKHITQASK